VLRNDRTGLRRSVCGPQLLLSCSASLVDRYTYITSIRGQTMARMAYFRCPRITSQ